MRRIHHPRTDSEKKLRRKAIRRRRRAALSDQPDHEASLLKTWTTASPQVSPTTVQALQRTVGNRATIQILQRNYDAQQNEKAQPGRPDTNDIVIQRTDDDEPNQWVSARPTAFNTPESGKGNQWVSARPTALNSSESGNGNQWVSARPTALNSSESGNGNQWVSARPTALQWLPAQTPTSAPTGSNASQHRAPQWAPASPSNRGAPVFSPIKSDKFFGNSRELMMGGMEAFKTGKKPVGATQQIMDGNQQQTPEQTPAQHGTVMADSSSQAATALQSFDFATAMAAFSTVAGIVGQYLGLARIVFKFVSTIKKIKKGYKTWQKFKKAAKNAESAATSGDAKANIVHESAQYGAAKTKRRFLEVIAKGVLFIAKSISTVLTFISGGTVAVITGTIDLFTSSANALFRAFHTAKALWKAQKGTKGVHRAENAEALINAAFDGQPEALKLVHSLKVGKELYEKKLGVNQGIKGSLPGAKKVYPKNLTQFLAFLRSLKTKDDFDALRDDLKEKMSSSAFQSKYQKMQKKAKKLGITP